MNTIIDNFFPLDRIYISSLILYILNWILLIYFSYSNFKKYGIFSFTFIWIFFSFFLAIQFPFFFAFSDLNRIASPDIYLYVYLVNDTFIISSIGFYSFVIGALFSNRVSFTPIGLPFTYKSINGIVNKQWVNYVLFVVILFGIFILLMLNVPFGDGRGFAMDHQSLRPIINLFISLYTFLFFIIWIIAVYKKRLSCYIIFILLIILNLWSGTRSSLLIPVIYMVATFSIVNKSKNLLKYLIYGVCILFLVFFIKSIRDSSESFSLYSMIVELFFGNTFSDLRDFTWIYYYWDIHSDYLFGKTFLSGIMSFIPSYISEFREIWSWGRWSTNLTYLDSQVHPGLRPGPFGEVFFNFGYLGVIWLGLVLGIFIGRLDKILLNFKRNVTDKKELFLFVTSLFVYYGLISSIVMSAGYFNIYLKIFILLIGYISFKLK